MNLGQNLTSKFGKFQKESWEYVSDDVDLQILDRNYDRFCGCTKYCVPLLAFFNAFHTNSQFFVKKVQVHNSSYHVLVLLFSDFYTTLN
jgi:hypothetical protein